MTDAPGADIYRPPAFTDPAECDRCHDIHEAEDMWGVGWNPAVLLCERCAVNVIEGTPAQPAVALAEKAETLEEQGL